MFDQINIVKRDGRLEPLSIEKTQERTAQACHGLKNCNPSTIEINAGLQFVDGMKSTDIQKLLIRSAVELITDPVMGHTDYQYAAGNFVNQELRKQVYGSYTPPRLYSIIQKNVAAGVYEPMLLEWYTEAEWDKMEGFIDHARDERYSHAAIEQLMQKYLVQDRVTGQIYETPQVRYIVDAAVKFHRTKNFKRIKQSYNGTSNGKYSLATPVLAGTGTVTKQFSSCVLIEVDDTLDSIYASGQVMGMHAARRAGIGLGVGNLRGLNAPIRGGQIKHTGLIPFVQKFFYDLRCCSQGGIRNASATLFYPIWHADFQDLIVLKNNQGTEETRMRHLDYGVMLNGYFLAKLKKGEDIFFFHPNQVEDMKLAFYSNTKEFIRLYEKYSLDPAVHKTKMSAMDVIKGGLVTERSDTGRIYLGFVDNIMEQGPYIAANGDVITQSNLCMEILLVTKPFQSLDDEAGRVALCTLGSTNWPAYKRPEDMREDIAVLMEGLSEILAYQDYVTKHSRLHTEEYEPLGIGVTGLAHWHAQRGLKYGSKEALAEVKRWMEHQTYYCIEASINMAMERGPCTKWHQTRYAQGIFPWEVRKKGVDKLTSFKPSPELDWEGLRARMLKYGMRNTTVGAIAPVESSSVVIESTNGMALPKELISIKESKAGNLVQVVPEYQKYKDNYQLMWEQPSCRPYLATAAVLSAFLDQSASTDTAYNPKNYQHTEDGKIPAEEVLNDIIFYYNSGGKTMYYHLTNKDSAGDGLKEEAPICEVCVL